MNTDFRSSAIGAAAAVQACINGPKLTAVETTTESMLGQISSAQLTTFDLINAIESRLALILSDQSNLKGGEAMPGFSVPLLERIQNRIDSANDINSRLSILLDRIAL